MALPLLAELISGLERRLGVAEGSLVGVEKARAEEALSDASAMVTAVGGSAATGTTVTAASPAALAVLYAAAKRGYLNLSGAEQETAGPFTVRWGSAGLLEDERAILTGLGGTGGLWTQPTTRGDFEDGTVYVPTGPPPSGYDLPWYADSDLL